MWHGSKVKSLLVTNLPMTFRKLLASLWAFAKLKRIKKRIIITLFLANNILQSAQLSSLDPEPQKLSALTYLHPHIGWLSIHMKERNSFLNIPLILLWKMLWLCCDNQFVWSCEQYTTNIKHNLDTVATVFTKIGPFKARD